MKVAPQQAKALSLALTLALTATAFPALAFPQAAQADQYDTRVAETAEAYNNAVAEQERLAAEIEELDSRIAEINEELPEQQQRSDESCVALYKYSYETSSMVSLILSSTSFTDALALLESYNWIITSNLDEVHKTASLKDELEDSRSQLEEDKAAADAAAAEAADALAEAQEARQEAQEAAAAAQAAEERAAQSSGSESSSISSESRQSTSSTNVNWTSDKQAFVNKWAPRIDAYLAGSPTAGCGQAYAAAAWDYGVDPRWAPAISYVESSKGAACFRSHNAWGYGSSGYGSWTEGINAVCRALGGSMYGGYLTEAAARTYCPPNWQHWYNSCAAEMAKI